MVNDKEIKIVALGLSNSKSVGLMAALAVAMQETGTKVVAVHDTMAEAAEKHSYDFPSLASAAPMPTTYQPEDWRGKGKRRKKLK